MDWKPHYQGELESSQGRDLVLSELDRHAGGDPDLIDTLTRGGIVSFPHTTVFESAEPIARTVASIYRTNPARVLALGVLHGAAMPEPFVARHREYSALLAEGDSKRPGWHGFERLRGAFFRPGDAHTPYGTVPRPSELPLSAVCREDAEILGNEFSLDLFLALMAAAAERGGRAAIPVFPVYVLLTREPGGSFATAREIAATLAEFSGGRTAVVATGDLVHYGNTYSTAEEMKGLPTDREDLERHFLPLVRQALEWGMAGRFEEFYRLSLGALKNDQRNLLPVLRELVGDGARSAVPWFRLTDYSGIWGVAPPCYVASTLIRFDRPS